MAKRMNLKEHLNDDILDLSLCDLQEVPVKDIATFPKATSLDLSSNKLVTLHKSFSISLTHLVKLDLARNQIKELPQNFGLLVNLKHLDLYKNCLETLPLTFGNLTALRWLDLKANPLETHWEQIVGPCFSKKDCTDAAKNVVRLSRMMNIEMEAELQRSQARQKKDEEAELKEQTKKREKQKEKKKRRNAAKLAEMNKETMENGKVAELEPSLVRNEESDASCDPRSSRRGYTVVGLVTGLLKLFVTLTAVLLLSVLVLSLVNPPVYRRLIGQVHSYTGPIAPMIPGHLRVTWHKATTNLLTFSKYAIANIYSLSRQGVRILNNIYIFVTTDPQFEVYLHLIIKYLMLVYLKFCEIVNFSFYQIGFLWTFSTELYQQYVSPFLK